MSLKRQRKAERRKARMRKSARPSDRPRRTEVGDSSRGVPDSASLTLSEVAAMLRLSMRGPLEEVAYDYGTDDHGWFVVPHTREPFELPLTAELESSWKLLAEQDPACAPILQRIRELRTAGREHVTATLTSVFWEALLPDGSVVCLEPDSDDEPVSVRCAELAGGTIGFWASELGFERFGGEVALPAYSWMAGQQHLPVAVARRVGERWTDAYRVRVYNDANTEHATLPPEVCPPRCDYRRARAERN